MIHWKPRTNYDEEDVKRLEDVLGVKLPSTYLKWAQETNWGTPYSENRKGAFIAADQEVFQIIALFPPKYILYTYQQLVDLDPRVAKTIVPIGVDGINNYYALYYESEEPNVVWISKDDDLTEFEPLKDAMIIIRPSFQTFLRDLREDQN
ncbi:SMI1/KNR4 family protein [Lihuaxuella thermophila]|uniref:SMI1-KNR4 cell-wall n=1 Tax=Lihuaxuella thermophila TaxID=1173111 RepID=A0A1H8BLR5_9BACL|nr:SMI1/KNR4 family protein [Lihuaxuella thermophila]SEM83830.1 SMI1-KNR4 cell-wall [Lihuaxuella thermophila]